MNNVDTWIRQLVSEDVAVREAAQTALRALDEDAVDPLINAFYAGVNESQGVAVLELVGEIGGPDALTLLRNVVYDPTLRGTWQAAARRGLLLNRDNLSPAEVQTLLESDSE